MKKLFLLALFVGFGLATFAEDEKEETSEQEVVEERPRRTPYDYDKVTRTRRLPDILDLEEDN